MNSTIGVPATPQATFREPTRSGRVVVGNYPIRLWGASVLIWASAFFVVYHLNSIYLVNGHLRLASVLAVAICYGAFALGWFALPGVTWRRAVAAVVGLVSLWAYLHTFIDRRTGIGEVAGLAGAGLSYAFQAIAITAVIAAWFLVRQRSFWSYLLVLPFAFGAHMLFGMLSSGHWWSAPLSNIFDLFVRSGLPVDESVMTTLGFATGWLLIAGGSAWTARLAIEPRLGFGSRWHARHHANAAAQVPPPHTAPVPMAPAQDEGPVADPEPEPEPEPATKDA